MIPLSRVPGARRGPLRRQKPRRARPQPRHTLQQHRQPNQPEQLAAQPDQKQSGHAHAAKDPSAPAPGFFN